MNKGLLKRLLHYVFRIFVVPHHLPCYAKDRVCGLFAKDSNAAESPRFAAAEAHIPLSQTCVARLTARSFPVVTLQTLRGHATAPI